MNWELALPLAQAQETFWKKAPGTANLWIWIIGALLVGTILVFAMSKAPVSLRRWIVVGFTFLAGLPYVLQWIWPAPISAKFDAQLPNDGEQIGFFINQMVDPVGKVTNILQGFLLGVGIFSLVVVHSRRIRRKTENWGFSAILMGCFVLMATIGFWDWTTRLADKDNKLTDQVNWGFANYANDLLFDGLYQQMDSAMFSMIAFFILSAAYRAFRVRSIEATVMMISALILILNLMGLLTMLWTKGVEGAVIATGNPFLLNFKLTTIADWVKATLQIPAIRAIDFGVGLGALAMGLRIWLGLERGGVSA